jgi:hypothetical protein
MDHRNGAFQVLLGNSDVHDVSDKVNHGRVCVRPIGFVLPFYFQALGKSELAFAELFEYVQAPFVVIYFVDRDVVA